MQIYRPTVTRNRTNSLTQETQETLLTISATHGRMEDRSPSVRLQCRYTIAILYVAYNISIAKRYIQAISVVLLAITLKRTLVKIGGSLRLTIPPEVANLLHAGEGDEIEFSTTNGDVIIKKVKD